MILIWFVMRYKHIPENKLRVSLFFLISCYIYNSKTYFPHSRELVIQSPKWYVKDKMSDTN